MSAPISVLWVDITQSLFGSIDEAFLDSFRAPGGANRRLAAWDPFDRSTRYYKFLLFHIARRKPLQFFDAYRRLSNTGLGNPIYVTAHGCHIDIDYLFAVEEFFFLRDALDLSNIRHIVEIGAGFGRTCHTLLSLSNEIDQHTIIDLGPVLKLSRAFLSRAAPELVGRVNFIDKDDRQAWSDLRCDLVINIDSFQEMPTSAIDDYMKHVVRKASAFYCKNPTGKYLPADVGLPHLKPEQMLDVYSLGYCQDIFDIFDDQALDLARQRYLRAYLPTDKWTCVDDEALEMFPYVHHALFANPNPKV